MGDVPFRSHHTGRIHRQSRGREWASWNDDRWHWDRWQSGGRDNRGGRPSNCPFGSFSFSIWIRHFFFFIKAFEYSLMVSFWNVARLARKSVHAARQIPVSVRRMLGFHRHYGRRISDMHEQNKQNCFNIEVKRHLLKKRRYNLMIGRSFACCQKVNNNWSTAAEATAPKDVTVAFTRRWVASNSFRIALCLIVSLLLLQAWDYIMAIGIFHWQSYICSKFLVLSKVQ